MKSTCLLMCLVVTYSGHSLGDDSSIKNQFKVVYQQYIDAQQQKKSATDEAKQAYVLGKELYGDKSDNTASLAINYANELDKYPEEVKQQRFTLFEQAYTILAANHPANSIELIDPLLGMAESTTSTSKAVDSYEQVISIAQAQKSPKLVADMQLAAAQGLAYGFSGKKYSRARSYLLDADEYYSENLPENSVERIKADFLVAAFAQSKKQYAKAIERLNRVVDVFDNELSFDHKAELSAHSKLVYLYEKTGESDEATKHCIAIAKMVPWQKNQEQTPLYRQEPQYPKMKAKRREDGSVQVEFDVTTSGFVKNVTVLKSTGGEAFEKEAIKAMEKWRYAPKFENGAAVVAKAQVQLDFKISR
ncbi:TonB family protein [Pseudoalteromonas sp.]|uniref:TonB family protein n=1 Tax=Pseudoalteromonas sp. TaxID=53249 RepID=UPI00300313AE